ncbi:MAG: hypothetical protein ACI8XO_000659 [Verrucomicrobiales bacterium]|jgi:hypothetical protein
MTIAELPAFLSNPFVWGLALGLLFFAISLYAHLKTKLSLNRYKKLLSDKLEIDAEATQNARKQRDALKVENENLRTRVTQLSEKTDGKLQHELEILSRAEKAMMISAPGFAPAWENAKTQAADEVAEEDRGNALPKRIFRKFFGGNKAVDAIEMQSEHAEKEEATS